MARSKRNAVDNSARINLPCTTQQKEILAKAAAKLGCDVSTMVLTYTLKGIGALGTTGGKEPESADLPVIVNGKQGAALRSRADEHGVSTDRMLELLLIADASRVEG